MFNPNNSPARSAAQAIILLFFITSGAALCAAISGFSALSYQICGGGLTAAALFLIGGTIYVAFANNVRKSEGDNES
jgi:hypothetical protein